MYDLRSEFFFHTLIPKFETKLTTFFVIETTSTTTIRPLGSVFTLRLEETRVYYCKYEICSSLCQHTKFRWPCRVGVTLHFLCRIPLAGGRFVKINASTSLYGGQRLRTCPRKPCENGKNQKHVTSTYGV